MIEVEAKIRLKGSIAAFRKKARQLAHFIGREHKIDDYYTLLPLNRYAFKSLRIRKRKGFAEVNFKQPLSYKKGVYAKREVEFRIKDYRGFLAFIREFGFKHWLRKEKTTELYHIRNNFHIELNHVKGLGWFAEIEVLCQPQEIAHARNEVLRVTKALGIRKENIIKTGYTKMLWNAKKKQE